MATICDEDKQVNSESTAATNNPKEDDKFTEGEQQHESSSSLSNLPMLNQNYKLEKADGKLQVDQEDFNFNSCGGSFLGDSQMCAADEVFFKGKLLPFRHSISSETGLTMFHHDIRPFISRSQSLDQRYTNKSSTNFSTTRSSSIRSSISSGTTTRSSSIRSSLSSGSTTTAVAILHHRKPPRARTPNQFHSHPSPIPQIRHRHTINQSQSHHWSQKWRFFHMGSSVQTTERKFADLKIRDNNIKKLGSRNSNSSSGGSSSENVNRKNNYWTIFNECKCRVDAIDQRRLVSDDEDRIRKKKKEKRKKVMSRDRTFEWLKQQVNISGDNNSNSDEIVLAGGYKPLVQKHSDCVPLKQV